jgi:hypothetical protein
MLILLWFFVVVHLHIFALKQSLTQTQTTLCNRKIFLRLYSSRKDKNIFNKQKLGKLSENKIRKVDNSYRPISLHWRLFNIEVLLENDPGKGS